MQLSSLLGCVKCSEQAKALEQLVAPGLTLPGQNKITFVVLADNKTSSYGYCRGRSSTVGKPTQRRFPRLAGRRLFCIFGAPTTVVAGRCATRFVFLRRSVKNVLLGLGFLSEFCLGSKEKLNALLVGSNVCVDVN